MEVIQVEALFFTIKRTDRKSLGITIERDGTLTINAPHNCDLDVIEQYTNEKLLWVYRKIINKKRLLQSTRNREFISGEGFFYLGKTYKLKIVSSSHSVPPLRLYRGQFELRYDAQGDAIDHFTEWYTKHGQIWLYNRTNYWSERMNVMLNGTDVGDLGYRWGRCKNRYIEYHWRVLLLPIDIVDYIIVHELAHIKQPHHKPEFWQLVSRYIPDFKQRKGFLAEKGAGFDI